MVTKAQSRAHTSVIKHIHTGPCGSNYFKFTLWRELCRFITPTRRLWLAEALENAERAGCDWTRSGYAQRRPRPPPGPHPEPLQQDGVQLLSGRGREEKERRKRKKRKLVRSCCGLRKLKFGSAATRIHTESLEFLTTVLPNVCIWFAGKPSRTVLTLLVTARTGALNDATWFHCTLKLPSEKS